jgi:hypothetical protein
MVDRPMKTAAFIEQVRAFCWDGQATAESITAATSHEGSAHSLSTFTNEFWTSKQRDAHSLHEISYRACFKPQLPRFFIDRLTDPGDVVYDPFSGRGTTPLEAALAGRLPMANDINPLSALLLSPRLAPPTTAAVHDRLGEIDLHHGLCLPSDLLTFYHPETLLQICALRAYLLERTRTGVIDAVDDWIRMVAVNRLTGHSPGFFSVYTLPPNQATSVTAQRKINAKRNQVPPRRDVAAIILKKTRALLKDMQAGRHTPLFEAEPCPNRTALSWAAARAAIFTGPASHTPGIPTDAVDLVVTSPPFLDIVQYKTDNWLRCWFCDIAVEDVPVTTTGNLETWRAEMTRVFLELCRVLKPGGVVAFEVGEVRKGAVRLEETVIPCGIDAGLHPVLVLINAQRFTKTAKVWGVSNNRLGTNTNRIVVFTKPSPQRVAPWDDAHRSR